MGRYGGNRSTNCSVIFPGYGRIWIDQDGPPSVLALTDRRVREETRVIYDPRNGFVVTTPGGIWRFRRGNFGWQYLDQNNLHYNDLDHAGADHHNTDYMLRESIPGHDLPPRRWGLFHDREDGQAGESFWYLGAIWALYD